MSESRPRHPLRDGPLTRTSIRPAACTASPGRSSDASRDSITSPRPSAGFGARSHSEGTGTASSIVEPRTGIASTPFTRRSPSRSARRSRISYSARPNSTGSPSDVSSFGAGFGSRQRRASSRTSRVPCSFKGLQRRARRRCRLPLEPLDERPLVHAVQRDELDELAVIAEVDDAREEEVGPSELGRAQPLPHARPRSPEDAHDVHPVARADVHDLVEVLDALHEGADEPFILRPKPLAGPPDEARGRRGAPRHRSIECEVALERCELGEREMARDPGIHLESGLDRLPVEAPLALDVVERPIAQELVRMVDAEP